MSLAGRLATLFPALHVALCALCLFQAATWLGDAPRAGAWLLALAAVTYGLPVLVYRAVQRVAPLREGLSDLSQRRHSPWWTSLHLQWIYFSFPALEALLRMVPGLYSAWLRAWGSRVGRGVNWTPRVEILDRGMLEIGDGAILGHRATLSSHVVTARDGRSWVYVRRVRIGSGVLVGGHAMVAPGVHVGQGATIGYGAVISINARIGAGARIGPAAILDAGIVVPAGAEVPNAARLLQSGPAAAAAPRAAEPGT